MGFPLVSPKIQFFDSNGNPLVGGKLYTKTSGGGVDKPTYTNANLTVANTNPIILDARGEALIFAAASSVFWLRLTTADDVTLWTVDLVKISSEIGTSTNIISLYSTQGAEPYSNTYVSFKEPSTTVKGNIGFANASDNTMSMHSYEDDRLRFSTGTPGSPGSFLTRMFAWGTVAASWLGISAPTGTTTGGAALRFTTSDHTVTKGSVGYNATTNDHFDVLNSVSAGKVRITSTGGNIELSTTGTGQVTLPLTLGNGGAPALAVTGDLNTGIWSSAADSLSIVAGSSVGLTVNATGTTTNNRLRIADGTFGAPSLTFSNALTSGLYLSGPNNFSATVAGLPSLTFKATGAARFTPQVQPATAELGDVYYDSGTNKLKVYDGAWTNLN